MASSQVDRFAVRISCSARPFPTDARQGVCVPPPTLATSRLDFGLSPIWVMSAAILIVHAIAVSARPPPGQRPCDRAITGWPRLSMRFQHASARNRLELFRFIASTCSSSLMSAPGDEGLPRAGEDHSGQTDVSCLEASILYLLSSYRVRPSVCYEASLREHLGPAV